ncbi:MAG: M67 family metallopeptidase [Helicobacteraceae bacterium]|jgi:proteasome lid subunit RPN8/RPN11|nr:M67 family metallopeptidase [Helicobacteraceae bacterium]
MLSLSFELEKIIRTDGEAAYPNECCGVLIGEVDTAGVKIVRRAQAINNAREDGEQYHRFLITPEDMLRAEQTARAMKLDVIGFYHSHPDHPSAPSGYDKDHALPFYSYVIISVDKGKAQILTSWELKDDRSDFTQEKIIEEVSID